MLAELKQKLDQQYEEMWPSILPKTKEGKTDWWEVVGSIITVSLIGLFGYLWFKYL